MIQLQLVPFTWKYDTLVRPNEILCRSKFLYVEGD